MIKKTLRLTFKTTMAFLLFIVIYIIAAIVLSYLSVNANFKPCEKEPVQIYILTNGVHTDLVLPFKTENMIWRKFLNPAETRSGDTSAINVAFGWGDKGFYLQTKSWSDLKFKTAFNAMFYMSSSAMHVTFYKKMKESEHCRKILISKQSYLKLVNYISESFSTDQEGIPYRIKDASYWDNDVFYEAKGTYGLFNTCNTWANKGLKTAGLKACLWTPFDKGIFYHYKIDEQATQR